MGWLRLPFSLGEKVADRSPSRGGRSGERPMVGRMREPRRRRGHAPRANPHPLLKLTGTRHREERSDAAIQGDVGCLTAPGLLRCARNDGFGSTRIPVAVRLAMLFLLPLLVALASPALAVQPDEVMKDPALEARARALSSELRCLVCQNESIDDSEAPLARDIRVLIRERIGKGESNDSVRAYLVSRYGDFILLKPPFKPETLLLWLSPVLVLGLGVSAALFAHRRAPSATPRLSAEEEARLATLTNSDASGG
jgi:cytochrome c-type biogenesis protein CcmH